MPFGLGKSKVRVTVVDADNGTVIAKVEQELENIPASFDESTTINLGDREFQVVEADPGDRRAFEKSKRLTLKVRQAVQQYIKVSDLLFSLPTITNEVPQLVPGARAGTSVLEMHEDDWRQIELVSKALSERVDCELEEIDKILRYERLPAGAFKRVHVRSQIMQPLADTKVSLAQLQSVLKCSTRFDGISFYGADGLIDKGFGFEGLGGVSVYGLTDENGDVRTIGIISSRVDDPDVAAEALSDLLEKYKLLLVDWCAVSYVQSERQLRRYLERSGGC